MYALMVDQMLIYIDLLQHRKQKRRNKSKNEGKKLRRTRSEYIPAAQVAEPSWSFPLEEDPTPLLPHASLPNLCKGRQMIPALSALSLLDIEHFLKK